MRNDSFFRKMEDERHWRSKFSIWWQSQWKVRLEALQLHGLIRWDFVFFFQTITTLFLIISCFRLTYNFSCDYMPFCISVLSAAVGYKDINFLAHGYEQKVFTSCFLLISVVGPGRSGYTELIFSMLVFNTLWPVSKKTFYFSKKCQFFFNEMAKKRNIDRVWYPSPFEHDQGSLRKRGRQPVFQLPHPLPATTIKLSTL